MLNKNFEETQKNPYRKSLSIANFQIASILDVLTNEQFKNNTDDTSSIGEHIRHIISFFVAFNSGVTTKEINYDQRIRNKKVETNVVFAKTLLNKQIELTFLNLDQNNVDAMVQTTENGQTACSTLGRELMALQSHTTHHLALIKPMIQSLNIEINNKIGRSQSTIDYHKKIK